MALPQKLLRLISAVTISFIFISILYICSLNLPQDPLIHFSNWPHDTTQSPTTNGTLGFEKILIVSNGPSWRISGLRKAAAFTSLSIALPTQPVWTTTQVDTFRSYTSPQYPPKIGPGQARCWLGHLNALKEMISHQYSSALVLEDDVDWDINIKQQLTLIAPQIRALTNYTMNNRLEPYGEKWDLLWLGHCGDAIPSSGGISIFDQTLPETAKYRENDGTYITLTPKPQIRYIHTSQTPFCTYGYAVTNSAAQKILQLSTKGMRDIITTELRTWCQSGELRCVTVNPELFHHHKSKGRVWSEIAVVEGWRDMAGEAKVDFTANIRYSARCNRRADRLVSCQDEFGGVGKKGLRPIVEC